MTDILSELESRQLLAQTTDIDALREHLAAGMVTMYIGFDPTAPSLHIGSLSQIATMRRFQLAGHRPIALVGGSTGLIGDPKQSGERSLNDAETVAQWSESIRAQIARFLSFEGENACVMANNYDWTAPISALEFLRDIGKHFSVNRMLDREAVSARLAGNGISYTEFSYVLLQSLDFLELNRNFGCTLQVGGSDQWGNITAGCDLVRRMDGASVHGLTTPLITKADGTKFGKTESGTVWLDPERTSPYAFFQFWLNADDRDVPTLLRTFSFRPLAEIEALIAESAAAPHLRLGQRELAREVTAWVHGEEAAKGAEQAGRALFGQADLAELDLATLEAALAEAGMFEWNATNGAPTVVDALVATGIAASRGAARRAVEEGGAYINNTKALDPEEVLESSSFLQGKVLVVRRGKRTVAGLKLTS